MSLNLPVCKEVEFRKAIIAKLRANPILHSVVRRWYTHEGCSDDARPISDRDFPYVSVATSGGDSTRITMGSTTCVLGIDIDFGVWGTNEDDALNLWGVIRTALFPGDGSMDKLVRDLKGAQPSLTRSPFSFSSVNSNPTKQINEPNCIVGTGTLEVEVFTATRG